MRPAVERAHAVATDSSSFAVAYRLDETLPVGRALFAPGLKAARVMAKEPT